mmetsp:Transcript_19844/g.43073  ORF Transcript_19844/g.43073 Transcript_19844/m.43073 type:complete len:453 (-) Transcript_19844:119-1477(-)|eukprot:CAMPEP_0168237406 /NCGR_PEP_ID=MMETSP0140_2-20121125/20196_1 /TAXON_ID=44445 /ORGANISM="Pseudo-nitzschia australis, Strain 10249 10 AB" /LENGTH=452 /DNA_ID=CAMNT_0008171091 /DNA_START=171 /DNA_END=1529 /DNA_ORIENTATION=-
MEKAPAPPLLPPSAEQSDDCSSGSEDEHQQYGNEKTPLIRHTSRKSESTKNVFRKLDGVTELSAISDCRTSSLQSSWSDGETNINDDDDRSISTHSTAGESVASLRSLATVSLENFREGLAVPFTDEEGSYQKIASGLGSLCVVGTLIGLAMPKNQYLNGQWYPWYRVISSVIGYNYFVLWSICFYPQVLLNHRRKSTKGLSNDFAILNCMGWSFYSAYLVSMYFDHEIKNMYEERFSNESSVQSNDVAFSVHAMIMSFIYVIQIIYYGESWCSFRLKPLTWLLVLAMGIPSALVPCLIKLGYLPYSAWLDYFYVLSYFKICCTLTKYSKQVTLNWKRKSTSGWNIWYNFLECSGGSLSMLQITLDSVDMKDITGITGNIAKFALGFATIFFDAIFFTQHYFLYTSHDKHTRSSISEHGVPILIKTPIVVRSRSRLDLSALNGVPNSDFAEV